MKDTSAPLLDQARVQRSFRRGLETYHRHAVAQARIAQDLAAMLAGAGAPRKLEAVLEFGCGTGLLTEALLGRFGIAGLTLNDLVAEAAPGLQARTAGQARFLAGPIEQLPLPDGLDLIASASTVQWVEDIPALMARLAASLRPGGWLALSGFGRGHFPELAALGSGACRCRGVGRAAAAGNGTSGGCSAAHCADVWQRDGAAAPPAPHWRQRAGPRALEPRQPAGL